MRMVRRTEVVERGDVLRVSQRCMELEDVLRKVRERMHCPNCDGELCHDCAERFGDLWPEVSRLLP